MEGYPLQFATVEDQEPCKSRREAWHFNAMSANDLHPLSPFFPPQPQSFSLQEEFRPQGPGMPGKSPYKRPRSSDDFPPNPAHMPFPSPSDSMPPPYPPANKGKYFKTKLCTKFKLGTCDFGNSCTFAHGMDELRPNWPEAEQQRLSRLRICRSFYNGEECPYGDRCTFLHEDPDRVRESSAISIPTTPMAAGCNRERSGDGNSFNQKPFFWKTRLCHKWEMTHQCPYGDDCHYAHGMAELRYVEPENGNPRTTSSLKPPPPRPNNDVNDVHSSQATVVPPLDQEEPQVKRCLLNWKGPKKISRIYGDWIDDLSPDKVES